MSLAQEWGSYLALLSSQNYFVVLIGFSAVYLFKQSFAIPGSFFLNILAGALFGSYASTLLVCILTAIGSSFCYLLSRKLSLYKYVPSSLSQIQKAVTGKIDNSKDLFYYLLFLRLFPFTPNWLLNICSPMIGIPLNLFFWSMLLGSFPYNFVCTQAGALLASLESKEDIFTPNIMIRLGVLSFFALLPPIYKKLGQRKVELSTGFSKGKIKNSKH